MTESTELKLYGFAAALLFGALLLFALPSCASAAKPTVYSATAQNAPIVARSALSLQGCLALGRPGRCHGNVSDLKEVASLALLYVDLAPAVPNPTCTKRYKVYVEAAFNQAYDSAVTYRNRALSRAYYNSYRASMYVANTYVAKCLNPIRR